MLRYLQKISSETWFIITGTSSENWWLKKLSQILETDKWQQTFVSRCFWWYDNNLLEMSEIRNLADLIWESEVPAIISSVMEYSYLSNKNIMNIVDTTLP